jgi:hypothetical protein
LLQFVFRLYGNELSDLTLLRSILKVLLSIVLVLVTLHGSYSQGKKLKKDERKEKQQFERDFRHETHNPVRDASGISEMEASGIEIIGNRIVATQAEEKLELMLSKPMILHAGEYFFGEKQKEAQKRFIERLDHAAHPKDPASFNGVAKEFHTENIRRPLGNVDATSDEPMFTHSTSKTNVPDRYQFTASHAHQTSYDKIPSHFFDRTMVTFDRNETKFRSQEPYIIRTTAPNERPNNFSGSDFRTPTKPLSSYSIQKVHRRSQD